MTFDFTIQREKLDQAIGLLQEQDVDLWLTFVRETNMNNDPMLDLILGLNMTWLSAFLLTQSGERIAIVGRYDAQSVTQMGGYDSVIGYDQDIFPVLQEQLTRMNPAQIALNYSENDVAADGLPHGLWRLLNQQLPNFADRFVSAEHLVSSLRGRKSLTEVKRVQQAIHTTETILDNITTYITPQKTALDIYEFSRQEMATRGLVSSWTPCPQVHIGSAVQVGHTVAEAGYTVQVGNLVHMDIGVVENEYVSDIQRVWYIKKPDEAGIPEPLQTHFDLMRKAILAAADALRPGSIGWEVDAAARQVFMDHNIPEYQHAVGHHIGRTVHDGATVLGPRWARYGQTVYGVVEAGNIFTLELGMMLDGFGYIGLEEDVLVTNDGLVWLSTPQTDIWVIE